jgi:hypothetical protein
MSALMEVLVAAVGEDSLALNYYTALGALDCHTLAAWVEAVVYI